MLLIVTPNTSNSEEITSLSRTAESLGWSVYKPTTWRVAPNLIGLPGAVYGELFFCEFIAQQMKWKLFSDPLNWLATLPEKYVKREIMFTNLASARQMKFENKFVKPADDKAFTAKVYTNQDDLPRNDVLDTVPVLISDKVDFVSEYRCFVKDRKVVSISCYQWRGEVNKVSNWYWRIEPAVKFVNKMLKDSEVSCAPGNVIDVGVFKDDSIAVIESNPAYASGLYGCERVGALDVVRTSCGLDE